MITASLILFYARKSFGGVKGFFLFLALCFAPGCIIVVRDPLATDDNKPAIAEAKPAKSAKRSRKSHQARIAADNRATDRLLDAARK